MRHIARRALWTSAAAAALATAFITSGMAQGSKVALTAALSGAAEVPPKDVPGTGAAVITLDQGTKTLTWEVSYSGLTGEARAAHFHGPAAVGANAGVALPMTVSPSPIKGTAQLTDQQMTDLLAGKWYVNIHTPANGGGELRGQVVAAK